MQALRFGARELECLKAIDIAFELAPKPCSVVYKGAMKTLAMVCSCYRNLFELLSIPAMSILPTIPLYCTFQAHRKFLKDHGAVPLEAMPEVSVPDSTSIRCSLNLAPSFCKRLVKATCLQCQVSSIK